MAAPTRPTGTKRYLRDKWVFVPTGTFDPNSPSLAILNAASALDVTNIFYDSSAIPTQQTNLVKSPKRVGDAEVYESIGETSSTWGEVHYPFNPQAASGSPGKLAYEKFPEGTTGFMVNRLGIDRNTDLATAQFVTSYPVAFGPQIEGKEGDNEAAEVSISQTIGQTGPKVLNKAIVA